MFKSIIRRWVGVDKLEAEIERLARSEKIAVDALKDIATKAPFSIAVQVADVALREIGLTPWVVTSECPPDRIYMLPKGFAGRPTDYF